MFNVQAQRRIPVLMGTQHPDNAGKPFWCDTAFIGSTREAEEIYENFFTLGCDEYMWDWEGKFADEAMIEKLFSLYAEAFQKEQLGRDRFITLRVPNIWEEKTFKLVRAYMSVISAAQFVGSVGLHTPPVFEFILPMTKRADQLIHIQKTFFETAKLHEEIFGEQGLGQKYIHIIPLFESIEDLSGCATVLHEFLRLHKEFFGYLPPHLRIFIARSDPALNAGYIPAVLATRLATREFYRLGEEYGIPVYPIVGTGSLPFRGSINPENIEQSLAQYEGIKTVTIQSAFRYDYPLEEVKKALDYMKTQLQDVKPLKFSDEEFQALVELSQLFAGVYRPTIEAFAPLINEMSKAVPDRRERVQHVGLFGYNRGVGEVKLPRAIKFTAAAYSLGIPPEFIGTGRAMKLAKERGLWDLLKKHFFTMEWELLHAGKFLNRENLSRLARDHAWAKEILLDVELTQEMLGIELGPSKDHHFLHRNVTSNVLIKKLIGRPFGEDLLEAALLRKSLG